jgi:aminoglycoside phosphotransferase (APT) family kinase protein
MTKDDKSVSPDQDLLSYQFRRQLFRDGVIHDPNAHLRPLTGGVSSDIYLVEDGDRRMVAKRALATLRVQEPWTADVSRNRVEMEALRFIGGLVPNVAPKLLVADPNKNYFVMEYFDARFLNWKQLLLSGTCCDIHARIAGGTLGVLHRRTWGITALAAKLGQWKDFRQLRTAPYLEVLADKHPTIATAIAVQIDYLRDSPHKCLVHGDYSPKNILFCDSQLVVLDWEVAWFGEPAFDIAFLLNHLLLKAILHKQQAADLTHLALVAWRAYAENIGTENFNLVAPAVLQLLPLLMLARVDGKSPVEYLCEDIDKDMVRQFALKSIFKRWSSMEEFCAAYTEFIKDHSHENYGHHRLPDI